MMATGRTTLRPALEGLVEDLKLTNTNFMTQNRVYEHIGEAGGLTSEPKVLHFGGFEVGKAYKLILRIRNTSTEGKRMHLVPPTTPFFTATCDNKRGAIAPGLCDEVTVSFCPQQWRYYYDCVRIHAEGEQNLLIPIHAYPVMNETKFPKRIDFGKCALGEKITKRVKMECKVPIEFEYELSLIKPNPNFEISPMAGVIPAHGSVVVEVTYSPTRLQTETAEIEIKLAEFNSKPTVCTIMGSAMPGLAKERMLQEATGTSSPTMEQLDGTAAIKKAPKVNKGGGTFRGGAGGGDAFTELVHREKLEEQEPRDCRLDGPIKMKMPRIKKPPREIQMDQTYLPDGHLTAHGDLAYVLNQEPGKLRIKDIKGAIATKKMAVQDNQIALDQIMESGIDNGVHPLERPEVPAHIKEALFEMQLMKAAELGKKVNLGSHVHRGEEVMTTEEVLEAQRLRQNQHEQHQRHTEQKAMRRLWPELQPDGALHLPSTSPSSMAPTGSVSKVSGIAAAMEGYVPEWRLLEADDWKKRTLSLERFKRAINVVVVRLRVDKRRARIRNFLAQVGRDKERLAEEAANPVLLVSESDRPGSAPTNHLKPEMVRTRPLPVYRHVNFPFHSPVEMSHYTDFDELGPMKLKVPLEYKLLGYEPEEFPGLTEYTPQLLDQPLEPGAPEEAPGLAPSGVVTPLSSLPAMPDSCRLSPFVGHEIGNRYSNDKVFSLPEPSWGMDSAYAVQPREYHYYDSTRHEPVQAGSVYALRGSQFLAERWLPRRDNWRLQLSEETVPTLLNGPETEDLLDDRPDDADKPPLHMNVPTDEDIARYLTSSQPKAAAVVPPPAPAAKGGKPTTPPAPVPEPEPELPVPLMEACKAPLELTRGRKQRELDASKREAHTNAIKMLDNKISHLNETFKLPCHYSLRL